MIKNINDHLESYLRVYKRFGNQRALEKWNNFIKQDVSEIYQIVLNQEILQSSSANQLSGLSFIGWDFSNTRIKLAGPIEQKLDFSGCEILSLSNNQGDTVSLKQGLVLNNTVIHSTKHLKLNLHQQHNFDNTSFLGDDIQIDITSSEDLMFNNTKFGSNKKDSKFELRLNTPRNQEQNSDQVFLQKCKFGNKQNIIHLSNSKISMENSSFSRGSILELTGKGGENSMFSVSECCDLAVLKELRIDTNSPLNFKKLDNVKSVKIVSSTENFYVNDIVKSKIYITKNFRIRCDNIKESTFNGKGSLRLMPKTSEKFTNDDNSTYNVKELKINGNAVFKECTFNTSLVCTSSKINFYKCDIKGQLQSQHHPENLNIEIIDCEQVEELVLNVGLNSLKVQNCSCIGKFIISECKFPGHFILDNVTFINAPEILDLEFTGFNVDIKNIKFVDQNSIVALASFRALTAACTKIGYEQGAILFHGLELKTRYNNYLKHVRFKDKASKKDWPEKVSSVIHGSLTQYGTDLYRPIFLLFIGFLTFIDLSLIYNNIVARQDLESVLILSARNTVSPFLFALPELRGFEATSLSPFIRVLSAFHSIASLLLWFLIIFMVRRRFKL